jgi:hypothetical protein
MIKLAQAFTSISLLALVACGSSSTEAPTPDAPPSGDAPVSGSYDPCAGKNAGDSCKICPPGDSNCMETMELKVCGADGKCSSQVGEVQ